MNAETTLDVEHAAWLGLAELCEGKVDAEGNLYVGRMIGDVILADDIANGLCNLIEDVVDLTPSLSEALEQRAFDNRPLPLTTRYYPWWWPRNEDGWRERAEFCRRMAALCEKEMLT